MKVEDALVTAWGRLCDHRISLPEGASDLFARPGNHSLVISSSPRRMPTKHRLAIGFGINWRLVDDCAVRPLDDNLERLLLLPSPK